MSEVIELTMSRKPELLALVRFAAAALAAQAEFSVEEIEDLRLAAGQSVSRSAAVTGRHR